MITNSSRHRAFRTAVAITAAVATVAGLGLAGSASAATSVPFSSAVPTWAKKANLAGTASKTTIVEGQLYLALRDRAGAKALAAAVSDPRSPSYRQYVTPQQWIDSYAPTQTVFDAKVKALKAKKLTITGSPKSRQYIVFRGSVTAINKAFNTTLATYRVDGVNLLAPSTTPTLSAPEASGIAGLSLDQGRLRTRPSSVNRTGAAGTETGAGTKTGTGIAPTETLSSLRETLATPKAVTVTTPCSSYIGQRYVKFPTTYGKTGVATANCGYSPKQIRRAYGTGSSDGAGQTVAIIDAYASPTIKTDVASYAKKTGEAAFTSGQYTDYSAPKASFSDKTACGLPSGWQGEQTLDVLAVHALAPKANIAYAGGFNCAGGLDLALSKVLDRGLATIVSNSYGNVGEPTGAGSTAYINGEVNLQLQAAGQGIGLYFSSGDDGDEKANLTYTAPDFPASSPWVTAVGGTSIGLSKTSSRIFSVGWGNRLNAVSKKNGTLYYKKKLPGTLFVGGAGGGPSRIASFTQPSYQASSVPSSVAHGQRTSPDVAALADPFTGFLIGYRSITNERTLSTGAFDMGVSGGTSLAAPLVAAQMAVIQQRTGAQIGFANPTLYSVAKTTPAAFRDIAPRGRATTLAYSSWNATYAVTLDKDTSLVTRTGYDAVTGLGELNVASAAAFAPTAAAR
ncbi:protease pro-enzyme activation domain-containing protein [Frondihabitans sp. VKM Ac-2883]|uniref:S53 family peptidase n=1 Tax=Frondihabitans sp. VKM Ac-2883 TaxID=2783823 RepID=UPI00351C246C